MEVLLVHLVRIAWFAIIFPIVLVVIPCSKLKTFGEYLMGFTKRGKTMQKSNYVSNYSCLLIHQCYVVHGVLDLFVAQSYVT